MGKTYDDFIKRNYKYIQGYQDEYLKEECRSCFNAIRIGCGTKVVEGQKIHFNNYGCDFDNCKYNDTDSINNVDRS